MRAPAARRASALGPTGKPVTSDLFIPSLNDLIDADGKRAAALNRSVPRPSC
jgi:hypothetical protein